MLTFASTQRIYLAVEPVDMRKQFNGLWAAAQDKLHEEPKSGAVFAFMTSFDEIVVTMFLAGPERKTLPLRMFEGVRDQVSPTITAHPNFVREATYGGETDFRFTIAHRDDPERELTLTILVFEVPA